jgi:hypothetical protein
MSAALGERPPGRQARLLRNAWQQLHARIAEALEAQSPDLMENQPELFAQHFAEAGLVEKSVAFWGKAGQRSAARSAMAEAATQFQNGLVELARLPATTERHRQELEFCSGLGAMLQAVKGYAAPETGLACARAREMWEQLDSPLGVPPDPVRTIPLPPGPRRTRFGAALGRGSTAAEPAARRFCRTGSGSRVRGSKPKVRWQVCILPSTSGRGARALRPKFPPLACRSGRNPSPT